MCLPSKADIKRLGVRGLAEIIAQIPRGKVMGLRSSSGSFDDLLAGGIIGNGGRLVLERPSAVGRFVCRDDKPHTSSLADDGAA